MCTGALKDFELSGVARYQHAPCLRRRFHNARHHLDGQQPWRRDRQDRTARSSTTQRNSRPLRTLENHEGSVIQQRSPFLTMCPHLKHALSCRICWLGRGRRRNIMTSYRRPRNRLASFQIPEGGFVLLASNPERNAANLVWPAPASSPLETDSLIMPWASSIGLSTKILV